MDNLSTYTSALRDESTAIRGRPGEWVVEGVQ
jgi:hypothetical protein